MVSTSFSWYDCLYLDSAIADQADKIKQSIEEGKPLMHIYCIAFASNPSNLFDIMSVNELQFPYYKRKNIQIVGLAGSRKAAIDLLIRMIEEIYKETGAFLVKDYFCFN